MKRVVLLLILFGFLFVSGVEQPSAGVGGEDVEKIQDAVDNLPIGDDGKIDYDKYKPFKTRVDERIAEINKYVGPITKILFGVELTLSWVFIFSVVLWILLIELIVMPVSEIFDWGLLWSFLGAGIIATLVMQGFGKDFVIWIEALVTQWYIGAVVLVGAALVGVVYSVLMKYLGQHVEAMKKKSDKEQTDLDRKIIHAHAKLSSLEMKEK